MVHLNPTLRANHLVISSHLLTIQCQDSTQGNLLASMAQGLSHPDQLFQKLVHATDKGFIEQLAITPAWNNTSAYSATGSAGIMMPLYKRLSFSLNTIDTFLNNPPPGFKKNSFQLTTGLTYTLH